MAEHIVIRPETLKPYYYEAKRGDVDASPVYNWVPITFINRDSGRLEDYMLAVTLTTNGEAIANTIASKNMYLPSIDVLNSYMAVPLNKLMDSDERFGELPDQFTHPEDILALNFMYMVLDRPVTGTATIEKLKAKFDK
ncbi:hypothetical protein ADUPG1_005750 [Aduncisulcus paluster]|uniref:Uncharacterized protein n=1 Tax=Aduncisulcus paluster TaxID=2918883 RepID=A0ABQ5KEW8_9EUKA|nr:hypothetical protein ADUPG1_005750 [Aduncisulcus paluster]